MTAVLVDRLWTVSKLSGEDRSPSFLSGPVVQILLWILMAITAICLAAGVTQLATAKVTGNSRKRGWSLLGWSFQWTALAWCVITLSSATTPTTVEWILIALIGVESWLLAMYGFVSMLSRLLPA